MATEQADIRAAVKTRLAANFTAIPVIEPGLDVKVDGQSYFMQWDVDFLPSQRAALGATAGDRINGALKLMVAARKDATAQPGTATLEGYLDTLRGIFPAGLSVAAGALTLRFRVPSSGPMLDLDGWVGRELSCPFYLFT